jgi:hypothetical protein
MDEPLLWVHLQESDNIAMWLVRYPQIVDQVMDAFANLSTIQGATLIFDLMAGRDAAQALHMAALEGGFEYTATIFSEWYDEFCRALLYCWHKMNDFNEYDYDYDYD